jgi:hypothetical protein
MRASDPGWPMFDGKFVNYPKFKENGGQINRHIII